MKKILSVFLALAMILSFVGCTNKPDQPVTPTEQYDEQFNELMKQWFIEDMSSDYLSLHFAVNDPAKYGIENVEVSLGDVELTDEVIKSVDDRLATLEGYDTSKLSDDQLVTYKTLLAGLKMDSDYYHVEDDYGFAFTPNSGVNNNLVTNYTEFEIRCEQDIKDLITLIIDSERYINECIELTKQQAQEGIIQPTSVMDQVKEQVNRFIGNVEDNEVIKAASLQINEKGYDSKYIEEIRDAVVNYLIPAYKNILTMYDELYPIAKESPLTGAISDYENGDKYYEVLFAEKASSTKCVAYFEDALYDAIYNTIYDILDITDALNFKEKKEFNNPSEYGYSDPYDIFDFLKKQMVDEYPEIPEVDYTIDYLDESVTSDNVVAYYLLSPVDDVNKNVVKVNPLFCADDPNYLCLSLSHEGYPGHLYNHTYYFTNHPNNEIRDCYSFGGYAEGWAMYTEGEAYKYFVESYNVAKLNQLYDRLSYYLYAIIDIWTNYDGYDSDQIAVFLSDFYQEEYASYLAEELSDSSVGDPCMFVPYACGLLQMVQLREMAEATAGKNFNVKDYNKVILDAGETSFDVLEELVNQYCDSVKAE